MSERSSKGLIVVVEDDTVIRRIYTSGLSKLGFTVIAAESGEEGVSLLSQHEPRVVILDINLPGIDGIEVCRRTRSSTGGKAPVIFITSNDTIDILQQCIEVGGDDFIVKGGPISNVLDRVSYWARGASRRVTERQRRNILDKTNAIIEKLENSATKAAPNGNALATSPADDLLEHAEVVRIAKLFQQLQHKWPSLEDRSVNARVRRFGYITGLVNSVSKSNLEMKVRFMDFLKSCMVASGALNERELAGMFENWHDFYANSMFSDACATAEKDYAELFPND